MPQISHAYAVGRVRSAEKTLFTRAAVERLIACDSRAELARALAELGWGDASSVDQLADQMVQATCEFLRKVTPDANATDCFLEKFDALNLKTLVKSRSLGIPAAALSPNGTIAPELMRRMMDENSFKSLAPAYQAALLSIERHNAVETDPLFIDSELDKAMFRAIGERLKGVKQREIREYFTARADQANLLIVLRSKEIGRDFAFAEKLFVPLGSIDEKSLAAIMEAPAKARDVVSAKPYRAWAREGLERWEKGEGLAPLEKQMEDYQLSLFRGHRYEPTSLLPLVGYFLAREREAALVRLIAAAKTARLQPDAYSRLMREMYAR